MTDRTAFVHDLHMSYHGTEVLSGIDLIVHPGDVFALLGPNGAGKTTTMEILEGLRRPDSGVVEVLGTDPRQAGDEWRARIGVVLQSWRDHAGWRVAEAIRHFAAYHPRPYAVDELLDLVGLTASAGKRIKVLSGGQRRRLDLALALVGRHEILFLDEPTTDIDPQVRREVHDLISGLAREGTTVLITTHDLAEVERIANKMAILSGGRIVASGRTDELSSPDDTAGTVRWFDGAAVQTKQVADTAAFVAELRYRMDGRVPGLEVRRHTLEDAYLDIMRTVEENR